MKESRGAARPLFACPFFLLALRKAIFPFEEKVLNSRGTPNEGKEGGGGDGGGA